MNRELWIRRGAALGVGVCLILGGTSIASIMDDLGAIRGASAPPGTASRERGNPSADRSADPEPVIRAGTNTKTAIDEYLNGQLGALGLTITSITPSSVRSLGGGLKLAEVRIEAKAEGPAAITVAQWAAVNREAVRMKSLSMGIGADGEGVATIVLLVVVA